MACTAALILILDWRTALLGIVLFFGIALLTKMVSLASLVTMLCELILFFVLILTGLLSHGIMPIWEPLAIFSFMGFLIVLRHTENIKRLREGRENKVQL